MSVPLLCAVCSGSSTTKAAPSPRFSPARVASKGRHCSWSSIISELKPLRWKRERASVPPATTMSACPALSSRAPSIMALAADEQAVERVVVSPKMPKWSAMSCVLLPQSWCFRKSRLRSSSGMSKHSSVMSIPPTVVPDTSTMRGFLSVACMADFSFSTSMPASSSAWRMASMPNRAVRLIMLLAGMPSISFIWSLDKSTSPTGSSWCTDCRCFISPMPVFLSSSARSTSCLSRPMAETIPSPVIAMFIVWFVCPLWGRVISFGSCLRSRRWWLRS